MRNAIIFFVAMLFVLSMNYFIPNNGSTGLSLPINIISWCVAAFFVLFIVVFLDSKKYCVTTIAFPIFIIAVTVLTIPIFYAESSGVSRAGWRLAGLFAGIIFYFIWLQTRLSCGQRQVMWLLLLSAVFFQAVLALVQIFLPEFAWVPISGGRPYGIFQQPNVLASFMATGLALALMLFLLPGFILNSLWREQCRQVFLTSSLLLIPALLVWSQSRVGWLGGMLVSLLFLWRFGAVLPERCKRAIILLVTGTTVGLACMVFLDSKHGLGYLPHEGSNHARLTMLRDTLRMIAEKPFSGWGYGGFEYHFLHFRINQTPPTVVTEIANHPHNEILLWWVEGGVLALLGMALMLFGGVRLILQAWRLDQYEVAIGKRHAGEPIALCIILLPIALHTQLEYPFYLSALHFIVFLMVMATLEYRVSVMTERKPLPIFVGRALHFILPLASVATGVLMAFALQGGLTLTHAERSGLTEVSDVKDMPMLSHWLHRDRAVFDEQVNALLTYNHTNDETLLESYASWAMEYLTRHIDANVYANLIPILQYQEQQAPAEQLRHEAALLFPRDARFQVPLTSSVENVREAP